jgi:hypothetical protein
MSSNNPSLCDGPYTFSEQGKKVKMEPRGRAEQVVAIMLDRCVFKDQDLKCDGLFLFCGPNKAAAVLVELKGVDIERAFDQLAHVRRERPQYKTFVAELTRQCDSRTQELAFIISSSLRSPLEKEKLEERYAMRVKAILHSAASLKVPDLRAWI